MGRGGMAQLRMGRAAPTALGVLGVLRMRRLLAVQAAPLPLPPPLVPLVLLLAAAKSVVLAQQQWPSVLRRALPRWRRAPALLDPVRADRQPGRVRIGSEVDACCTIWQSM